MNGNDIYLVNYCHIDCEPSEGLMAEFNMCGYRCDLCKAYAPNVKKNDKRKEQIQVWDKYYGGFDGATIENIYCDGCRCDRPDAKRIDMGCPVRKCVIEKGLIHCGDCNDYPCSTFDQRKGLSLEDAKSKLGETFNEYEYEEYLSAFDNKTRLNEYIKAKRSK